DSPCPKDAAPHAPTRWVVRGGRGPTPSPLRSLLAIPIQQVSTGISTGPGGWWLWRNSRSALYDRTRRCSAVQQPAALLRFLRHQVLHQCDQLIGAARRLHEQAVLAVDDQRRRAIHLVLKQKILGGAPLAIHIEGLGGRDKFVDRRLRQL